MNTHLFFQEGSRNNFKIKKIAWISFAILFGIVFLLSQNFFAQADEQNIPDPDIQLTKSIEPATVYPDGTARITLGIEGTGELYGQRSPVDVMHTIDISGSMDWYGNIIYSSEGNLSSDWKQIDSFEADFEADSKLNTFDVLLATNYNNYGQHLRIKSPSDEWYGDDYQKPRRTSNLYRVYKGAENIRIEESNFEEGTWEIWAEGEDNRVYNLAVGKPPVRIGAAKEAAKHFIDIMQENDKVGVVSFSSSASDPKPELTSLNSNRQSIKDEIDKLEADGATAIGKGIEKAVEELTSGRERPELTQAIILLTDGVETECTKPTRDCYPLNQARLTKDEEIIIYTIGFGEADKSLLKDIADLTGGESYYADSTEQLEEIYNLISQEFSDVVASGTVLTDILPKDIEYEGNATFNDVLNDVLIELEPDKIIENPDNGTTTLIWNLGKIKINDEFFISFDVKVHKESGKHLANLHPESRVDFYNYLGKPASKEFPETFVNVISEGEEPEPSPTPGPSPSPSSGGSSYSPPRKYPDLSVTKTDGQMIADPNQILEYSISCFNIGDTEAKNVKVIDSLPDFVDFIFASDNGVYDSENNQVVWDLGNILAGVSRILNLQVKVFSETPAEGTALTNKVEIKTSSEDLDLSNNQAEDITNIGAVKGVEGKVEAEEVLPEVGAEFSIILLITMIVMGAALEIKEQLLKIKINKR